MSMQAGRPNIRNEVGVSLIELMIALVVGLLLLGGLIQVYLSSKQSYNAQEQLARMQEGGRFAMDLITRDLRRSGFWGGNVDLFTVSGNPGPEPPSHNCNSAAWGRMINWRVSGVNHTAAPGGYTCATGHVANTDILTVRYADAEIVATVPGDNGLFVRSTMFSSRVMTGALAGQDDNRIFPDNLTTPPAPLHLAPEARRLVSHAYYIGDSGQACPGGQAIPALRRVSLNPATGAPESELIATGVEQLQVRYLLNVGGNDVYVDAQNVANDQWPNVRAVRVWLLMRGECPEFGLVNNTTYTMGDLAFTPTANTVEENFRRQLYVSTVMLRNIAVR
jgi:type IV pilus assembly protein PilW